MKFQVTLKDPDGFSDGADAADELESARLALAACRADVERLRAALKKLRDWESGRGPSDIPPDDLQAEIEAALSAVRRGRGEEMSRY